MFRFFTFSLLLLIVGCSSIPTHSDRLLTANALIGEKSWQSRDLDMGTFVLRSYFPKPGEHAADDVLTVYFEGDGLAWETRYRPSRNPTPVDPVGLRMALQHPASSVAYLARPCQYVELASSDSCSQGYWTSQRFAPKVIDTTNRAVDLLKEMFSARSLRLVGYSGGGAIAALVAAQRDDVAQLITVAGNMDHRAWTTHHRLTPLVGSLNPADEWQHLSGVPQVHILGSDDRVITEDVLDAYLDKYPETRRPQKMIVKGYSHNCCWQKGWGAMYQQVLIE